jgi:cyclin B
LVDLPDYAVEVFKFLQTNERRGSSLNITRRPKFTAAMRSQIVDWVVDIHRRLGMHTESLHAAVRVFDVWASKQGAALDRIGAHRAIAAALVLVAKEQEAITPSAGDLCECADNLFDEEDLLRAEQRVFADIGFRLGFTTTTHFIKRYIRAMGGTTSRLHMLAYLACDAALIDDEYINESPSKIAAAAMLLATSVMIPGRWTVREDAAVGFQHVELVGMSRRLLATLRKRTPGLNSVRKKYASDAMSRVSLIELPEMVIM